MARKDIVLTQTLELFHKLHALVTGADASPGSAEGARAVPNAEAAAPGSPATSSVTPKLMAVKEKPAVACVPSIADMGLTRMPASGKSSVATARAEVGCASFMKGPPNSVFDGAGSAIATPVQEG